jgi:hypothetical protein
MNTIFSISDETAAVSNGLTSESWTKLVILLKRILGNDLKVIVKEITKNGSFVISFLVTDDSGLRMQNLLRNKSNRLHLVSGLRLSDQTKIIMTLYCGYNIKNVNSFLCDTGDIDLLTQPNQKED